MGSIMCSPMAVSTRQLRTRGSFLNQMGLHAPPQGSARSLTLRYGTKTSYATLFGQALNCFCSM
jgi:hypothetical protein